MSEPTIDYRALLGRYMREVVAHEGVHFADYPGIVLSRADSDVLMALWEEVKSPGDDRYGSLGDDEDG
jgi:hypothetical protein